MYDHFSRQAGQYAVYRPGYPPELFNFILSHVRERKAAWDCATGNGQTAIVLASFFEQVYATDISQKQIDHARSADNLVYTVQPAEKTAFADNSFDLVTVSQALHWFQFDSFYDEVMRVTKPGGLIAAWMYGLLSISPEIDRLIQAYHYETLGDYWDPARKFVDTNYKDIPFPFEAIPCPTFQMEYDWTLQDLEGYLNTWSALQSFVIKNKYNPVSALISSIAPAWDANKMRVIFPLHMRMGRIHK